MAKTLAQIEEGARQRADMEDDGNFISSSEARMYINASIQTFWDFLIGEDGGSLFATVSPQLIKLGEHSYQLPADFYRLVDVSVKTNSQYLRAAQADEQEYAQLLTQTYNGIAYTRYYLHWNVKEDRFELFLFPEPQDPDRILVRYIPQAQQLSLDADTLNLPESWIEWVMLDVAMKMLAKEESDTETLRGQQARLEERILDAINEINKTSVKRIRDIAYFEDRPRGSWSRFPLINYD